MTDLTKYKKVRAERDTVDDNIIRVNRKTPANTFVDDIIDRFMVKNTKEVTLSSLGAAISKTITIAEVVKHRVPGLHQLSEIKTIVLNDAYEPL
jgi:ribonuclease P/MRP protein subunit RPP25